MSGEPNSSKSTPMDQTESKNGISLHTPSYSSMTIGSKPGTTKKLTIKNFKCKKSFLQILKVFTALLNYKPRLF